jgi:uncharacterized cofD-like protein
MKRPLKLVVLGGGTGSFTLLSALKTLTPDITAVVNMSDDGGSTGVLRDELGVLPPGDIRQCLVALADDETSPILRQLFTFRFTEGALAGHSFGNLFLSATEKMTADFNEAVRLAGEVLHITGRVLPVTLGNVRLAIAWGDQTVRGEGVIDAMDFKDYQGQQPRLFLEPAARINPAAAEALASADVIVLAPGDVYTSLGSLLVVDGVAEALAAVKAPVAFVCNLVVNPRQTKGWSVADHVRELERLAGRPFITHVLYNTGQPDANTLARYNRAGERLVVMKPAEQASLPYQLIGKDLLSRRVVRTVPGDKLAARRSFIRHDGAAVARAIAELQTKLPI